MSENVLIHKDSFDISMRLDFPEGQAYPLYAMPPSKWNQLRRVASTFIDAVDNQYPVDPELMYRVDIPFQYGNGPKSVGDLRLTVAPLPSLFLARYFSSFDERATEIAPYAPLGFRSIMEADLRTREVTLNPAYFLMKVEFSNIPRRLLGNAASTGESDLTGNIWIPQGRDLAFLPTRVEVFEHGYSESTTGFQDESGELVNLSEYLLLPHTNEVKNMSVSLQKVPKRRIKVVNNE